MKASLRTKLLLVTATLLFLALSSYLILAVQLFNSDKSTYIFEGNATLVNTIAAETTANLKSIRKTLDLMSIGLSSGNAIKAEQEAYLKTLFDKEDELVDIAVFDIRNYPFQPLWQMQRREFISPYKISARDFDALRKESKLDASSLLKQSMRLSSASIAGKIPLMQMHLSFATPTGARTLVAHLRQDRQVKLFTRSEIFTTYLTDKYGSLLVHPDSTQMNSRQSIAGTKNILGDIETGFRYWCAGHWTRK